MKNPLVYFAKWFHSLQKISAAKIQRYYRRQPPLSARTRASLTNGTAVASMMSIGCRIEEFNPQLTGIAQELGFSSILARKQYLDNKWQLALAREERERRDKAAKVARSPPSMHPVPVQHLTCHHTGAVSD